MGDHYRKCLFGRSVLAGEKAGKNTRLYLLNLKDSICSEPAGENSLLTPALFRLMRHYYKTLTDKVKEAEVSSVENMADMEVRELAAAMTDIRPFYSVCSSIGKQVIQVLTSRHVDTAFLNTPVPVIPRSALIHSSKSSCQESVIRNELEKFKWHGKYLSKTVLSEVTRYQDPVPQRESSFPDSRWLEALLTALTSFSASAGLQMDFSETPFFIGYVKSPIANQIAKATLFMDHPASGNMTHGFISHILQMVIAARLTGFSREHIQRLIDHGYWSAAIDPEPNENYFGSVAQKHENKALMLVNHETLMNGRFPDCIQSQLCFGLMSAMLKQALLEPGGAEKIITTLSLPEMEGQSPEECVRQHIINLRALEYALAGATFELGDGIAESIARTERSDDKSFEGLMNQDPNHLWGEFLPSDPLTLKMTRAAVCSYLEQPDLYKVYQQVIKNGYCWLKPVSSSDEFISQVPYVVYPAGSEPPSGCLQPVQCE
ncbi:hypothetical protein [Endozoicomonas lisbonensis]